MFLLFVITFSLNSLLWSGFLHYLICISFFILGVSALQRSQGTPNIQHSLEDKTIIW